MKKAYFIPAQVFELCYVVKKSQFIARVSCVTDRTEAMQQLEQAKVDYPDAKHHCWAYLLGSPEQPVSVASSDDGEPSGSAGKPILNVLKHRQVGDVMVVVIRYFGGVKLGIGGLVRAYSAVTQQAVEILPLKEKAPMQLLTIKCDYSVGPELRRFLSQINANIIESDYSETLSLNLTVPCSQLEAFQVFCDSRKNLLVKLDS